MVTLKLSNPIKYIAIFFIGLPIPFSCKNVNKKKPIIIPFSLLNREDSLIDRGKTLYYKSEYFLIRNYSDDQESEKIIQNFVNENKSSDLGNYTQYDMVFYKESEITNIHHLQEHPRDLDRYSQQHDLLFDFMWSEGKFLKRYKYKDGKMMGTEGIIIKEISDSMKKVLERNR